MAGPLTTGEVLLRLGTSIGAAALIGINRDLRHKPAGVRTHALVSLWVSSAIGVCAGAGYWSLTWITTLGVLLVLLVGGPLEDVVHRAVERARAARGGVADAADGASSVDPRSR
jgi:uncharacterized membrane protein YhiD involved in acid resistance